MKSAAAPWKRRDARLVILQVLMMALIGTLLFRLAWMQIGESGQYRNAASSNSVREVVVPAQRGLILDQVGRPLVGNRSSLTVTVDRAELARHKDGGRAILTSLATQLGTTYEALLDRMKPCGTPGAPKQPLCWNGPPQQPAVVAEDVPQAVGLQLMERTGEVRAVRTELTPTRSFPRPYGANFAHVAGYLGPITREELAKVDPDRIGAVPPPVGRSGLEQQYNAALDGQPGSQRVAVSRSGQVTERLADTPAAPGENVVTSIDAHLQAVVEKQLSAAVGRARLAGLPGDSGAIVVMDVTNGRVLAMASNPTYDPNVWVGGIEEADYQKLTDPKRATPLLNRATQGVYAPASTFKVISAAAALSGGYSTNSNYECPSAYTVGGQVFRNYESRAYGSISLARALAVSCDTVFYRLANQMWQKDGGLSPNDRSSEAMLAAARNFGLGKVTGIDIPGEYSGRVVGRAEKKARYFEQKDAYCKRAVTGYPEVKPTSRSRLLQLYAKDFCAEGNRFRAGDALNFAIGQGDTGVTPLQMAMVYAAIANGGTLWKPAIARAILSKDGTVHQEINPQENGRLSASAATLDYIRRALAQTTTTGTAAGAFAGFPRSIGVAAKTGTAEVVGKASTSWFASFAPVAQPRYAVLCTVSQGGTGAGTCGPSVRAIYEALFGVSGSAVDRDKSVLKDGAPASAIPAVTSDGMGKDLAGLPSEPRAASPAPSPTRPRPGESGRPGESSAHVQLPKPTPSRPVNEAPVGIVPSAASRSSWST